MHSLKQSFFCAVLAAAIASGCATQKAPERGAAQSSAPGSSTAKQEVPSQPMEPGVLFDGKTLKGWQIADFSGKGVVTVSNNQINLGNGYMTGVTYTNEVPRTNYEISLEAKRVEGSDFFCGLTFPVGTNECSFIVGGWGGGTVGLSSINGEDASQNETTKSMSFNTGQWYRVRVRVAAGKIKAWIDDDEMVNLDLEDRQLSIRLEVEPSVPLGIATWNTGSAVRDIRLKRVE